MLYRATALVASIVVAGCAEGERPVGLDGGASGEDAGGPPPHPCARAGAEVICVGDVATECDGSGGVAAESDCPAEGLVCARGLGCRSCLPGRGTCDGDVPLRCADDGSGMVRGDPCDAAAGETCNPIRGACDGLCAQAEEARSYIGCEYFPTVTINPELYREFEFAVAVANPQSMPADVTITRGDATVETARIEPGELVVIKLPWVEELRQIDPEFGLGVETSALVSSGAYRLVSTVPVTAYQFNALDYEIPTDCADELRRAELFGDGVCQSHTNDASLLLPTHALTGSYLVLSFPSRTVVHGGVVGGTQVRSSPGFFTVVGVEESPVTVEIKVTAFVEASADGAVRALAPGESATFTLARGDALQLVTQSPRAATDCPAGGPVDSLPTGVTNNYCPMARTHDLTGSEVRSTGRVQVIAGHACAFVPFNRWACDHLEESVFPVESWGRESIVAVTRPLRGEPNLVRVVSAHDGNAITFEPPVHPPVTLGRGQVVELESSMDFRVSGSEPFAVMQLLVGQDYFGPGASGFMAVGDPGLSLVIPSEQFRSDYIFLAPASYRENHLTVIAPDGAEVVLDGTAIAGDLFAPIGATGMRSARLPIEGGVHRITGAEPFGITVHGFGTYTSYIYPGGLDIEAIGPPI
jgi:hypothetical protein